jgi:hypothetical protein
MRSPFDEIGKKREPVSEGELVEGAFTCQEGDCLKVVGEARYLTANHLVTWICPDGHFSKVTMNLD